MVKDEWPLEFCFVTWRLMDMKALTCPGLEIDRDLQSLLWAQTWELSSHALHEMSHTPSMALGSTAVGDVIIFSFLCWATFKARYLPQALILAHVVLTN